MRQCQTPIPLANPGSGIASIANSASVFGQASARIEEMPDPSPFAGRAQGDRPAQLIDRRHAVLPAPARRAAQRVDRAGRGAQLDDVGALGVDRWIGAKAQRRRRAERDAEDVLVLGHVAMPAQRRAGRVFGDQHVAQRLRLDTRPARDTRAQRVQLLDQRLRRQQLVGVVVVAAAEARDAAARRVLLVDRRLQRQRADQRDQRGLLVAREEFGFVGQALGQAGGDRLGQVVEQRPLAQDTPSIMRAAMARWNGMIAAR